MNFSLMCAAAVWRTGFTPARQSEVAASCCGAGVLGVVVMPGVQVPVVFLIHLELSQLEIPTSQDIRRRATCRRRIGGFQHPWRHHRVREDEFIGGADSGPHCAAPAGACRATIVRLALNASGHHHLVARSPRCLRVGGRRLRIWPGCTRRLLVRRGSPTTAPTPAEKFLVILGFSVWGFLAKAAHDCKRHTRAPSSPPKLQPQLEFPTAAIASVAGPSAPIVRSPATKPIN